ISVYCRVNLNLYRPISRRCSVCSDVEHQSCHEWPSTESEKSYGNETIVLLRFVTMEKHSPPNSAGREVLLAFIAED
ncbi:MAG: hypothetical protein ACREQV_02475, partial [Candidatus Binatia bacterium]